MPVAEEEEEEGGLFGGGRLSSSLPSDRKSESAMRLLAKRPL